MTLNCRHSKKIVEYDRKFKSFLSRIGLQQLMSCLAVTPDPELIMTLVERWRPETNTIHLYRGEATITLEDVHFLTGLSVDDWLFESSMHISTNGPTLATKKICREIAEEEDLKNERREKKRRGGRGRGMWRWRSDLVKKKKGRVASVGGGKSTSERNLTTEESKSDKIISRTVSMEIFFCGLWISTMMNNSENEEDWDSTRFYYDLSLELVKAEGTR
ncbi:Protein MAIN-LIKE 2 [Linum perenne]